jgi:predicted RNA-binding protein with PUA-like domain
MKPPLLAEAFSSRRSFAVGPLRRVPRSVTIARNPGSLLGEKPSMAYWLFKEEPDHFSYDDLVRVGRAVWDGISNNLALQNLRKVKSGDRVLYYHTGKEKAVVGEMRVVSEPRPGEEEKSVVLDVEPVRRWSHPVTLSVIKADPKLAGWDLVRNSRLSIVPVSASQWRRVEELSKRTDKNS